MLCLVDDALYTTHMTFGRVCCALIRNDEVALKVFRIARLQRCIPCNYIETAVGVSFVSQGKARFQNSLAK